MNLIKVFDPLTETLESLLLLNSHPIVLTVFLRSDFCYRLQLSVIAYSSRLAKIRTFLPRGTIRELERGVNKMSKYQRLLIIYYVTVYCPVQCNKHTQSSRRFSRFMLFKNCYFC